MYTNFGAIPTRDTAPVNQLNNFQVVNTCLLNMIWYISCSVHNGRAYCHTIFSKHGKTDAHMSWWVWRVWRKLSLIVRIRSKTMPIAVVVAKSYCCSPAVQAFVRLWGSIRVDKWWMNKGVRNFGNSLHSAFNLLATLIRLWWPCIKYIFGPDRLQKSIELERSVQRFYNL